MHSLKIHPLAGSTAVAMSGANINLILYQTLLVKKFFLITNFSLLEVVSATIYIELDVEVVVMREYAPSP